MEVEWQFIPGVALLRPRIHRDARGLLVETYNERLFHDKVARVHFVQDNVSVSRTKGTVRGLHFQRQPSQQSKLVRVAKGAIRDIAVDLRQGSPTFARHVAVTLTSEGCEQLWIPAGFAHGFCTLEDDTQVSYKIDRLYDPDADAGILWNDPELAISWPVAEANAILSDKDKIMPLLADIAPAFTYAGAE